jgi:D-sedoheptulose 7-phosphate isomerase
MSVVKTTQSYRDYSSRLISALNTVNVESWDAAAEMLLSAWSDGTRVFICGNGGSASTASHITTDWSKGLRSLTGRAMQVHCLVDNLSLVMALGNDLSFEEIFQKQIEMFAHPNDTLVVISGSGNSRNVINAVEFAREQDMKIIGLTGFGGGALCELTDLMVNVPVENMQVVEDLHLSFGHFVLEYIFNAHLESL